MDAKARLLETQQAADQAVLNYDDPVCRALAARTRADVYWFSATQSVPRGVSLEGTAICWNGQPIYGLGPPSACAACITWKMSWPQPRWPIWLVRRLTGSARRSRHFLVSNIALSSCAPSDGVDYYNDSKATNVDATLKAIAAFPGPLWIILGGKDKGSHYTPLGEPLHQKAKAALLIGAARPLIERDLSGCCPARRLRCTCRTPFAMRREHAAAGDTVLLAPACASFDQFENFEHRGRLFKHLVAEFDLR